MGRERRRRSRRSTGSRRTAPVPPSTPAEGTEGAAPDERAVAQARAAAPAATHPAHVRSDRVLARETATMIGELKRVAMVSGVCFGMLALLVVVERMQ